MLVDEGSLSYAEKSPDITFSAKDFEGIIPHEDDPMVMIL